MFHKTTQIHMHMSKWMEYYGILNFKVLELWKYLSNGFKTYRGYITSDGDYIYINLQSILKFLKL